MYIYTITVIILLLIYALFYHPFSEVAKREMKTKRDYLNMTISYIIVSVIPVVNTLVLLLIIYIFLEDKFFDKKL